MPVGQQAFPLLLESGDARVQARNLRFQASGFSAQGFAPRPGVLQPFPESLFLFPDRPVKLGLAKLDFPVQGFHLAPQFRRLGEHVRRAVQLFVDVFHFHPVGGDLSVGFLKKKPAGEKFRYANTDLLIG